MKRSRAPLFAGVGAATLGGSVSLARDARHAGAAALLLPPPHFFRYEQDDIREFYLQFAAHAGSVRRRCIYVDTPELTSAIEPETLRDLLATGLFAGVADNISEAACAIPELMAALAGDTAAVDARIAEFTAWSRQFPATSL